MAADTALPSATQSRCHRSALSCAARFWLASRLSPGWLASSQFLWLKCVSSLYNSILILTRLSRAAAFLIPRKWAGPLMNGLPDGGTTTGTRSAADRMRPIAWI